MRQRDVVIEAQVVAVVDHEADDAYTRPPAYIICRTPTSHIGSSLSMHQHISSVALLHVDSHEIFDQNSSNICAFWLI